MCFAETKRRLLAGIELSFCLIALACLTACATQTLCGKGSGKGVEATISPSLAKVPTDSEVRFMVTDAGKPVKSVEWLVNGVPGGDETYGTIAGGVYHSPAAAPDRNEVHIEARLGEGGRRLFSTVIVGPYDPDYKLVSRWTTDNRTEGKLDESHGISLDPSGNILISDPTLDVVYRYTVDGKFLGQIGHGKGKGLGYFDGPRDVKVDAKGRVYVCDGNLNNLQRFDPDGNIVVNKSVAEGGKSDLKRPHSIDIDNSLGRVYLADIDNERVAVFDENCNFLMGWRTPMVGSEKHCAPHGLGLDPNGDLFVSDYTGACFKYTGTGELLLVFAEQDGGQYHAMCTDRWGNVYIAARNPAGTLAYIKKYNDNGALVLTWVVDREGHVGYPKCLCVGPDDTVYVTDEQGVDVFVPTSSRTAIEKR